MHPDPSDIDPRLVPHLGTAEAIARLLHPHAEVVVHDAAKNCIAAIFNSTTGRRVGDPSGIEDLEGLASGSRVNGPYRKRTLGEGEVKYVSSVLADESGETVGLLCINFDVTALRGFLESGLRFLDAVESSESFDALFDDDWHARIDSFVRQYLEDRLLNLDRLDREQRLALVEALRDAGAFQAKASANYVANVLRVSRSTVYNDLAKLEKTQETATED